MVNHLVAMDLVFAALIGDGPMPERGADHLGNDPVEATQGPSGPPLASNDCKSGSTICSLTDRTCRPPEFVRKYLRNSQSKALVFDWDQLSTQARTGRFAEPQSVSDTARHRPARRVPWTMRFT